MGRLGAALQSECLLSGNCWDSVELNTAAAGLQTDEKKQPSVNQWTLLYLIIIVPTEYLIFHQNSISLYFLIPQTGRDPVWENLAKFGI